MGALNHYADDVEALASAPKEKKRKTEPKEGEEGETGPSAFAGTGSSAPKAELNVAISKILKRVLSKTDVVYESEKVEGVGFQATVKLPCLPGDWNSLSWTGEAYAKRTDAEHSAA